MSRHLSSQLPESDAVSGYSQTTRICESIIAGGVILFLTSLIAIGIICAFTSYSTVSLPKEEYVVQSAFIEVIP